MPRCKNCKEKFTSKYFNQKYCMEKDACIKEFSLSVKDKKWKEEKKVMKESLKTLSDYEREAKDVFQRWVRLRDKGLPCISCDNGSPTDWSGGHYFPAGQYSGMIFDERNCHAQCNSHCNRYLSGNLVNYRMGLVNRYGEEFVKKLESDAILRRDYKYTKTELTDIKNKYLLKIKELSK